MKTYLLAAASTVAVSMSANAALVHRYTFDDGTANDSVGTANGSLVGGATIDAASGRMVTTGQTINSTTRVGVSLPVGAAAGSAVAGLTGSFTVQTIYSDDFNVTGFHNVFGFYTSSSTNPFLIAQSTRNSTTLSGAGARATAGGTAVTALGANALGTDRVITVTYNATTSALSFYVDGTFQSSQTLAGLNLQNISTYAGIGGFGPYSGNFAPNGSTTDFRIFDSAVTADQVTALYNLGAGATNSQIAAAVPEPASLGGLACVAVGVLARRRRV